MESSVFGWWSVQGILDGVLGLLAGLLDVRRSLIGSALRFQALVIGRPTSGFFDLAGSFLAGVLDLVSHTHRVLPSRGTVAILTPQCPPGNDSTPNHHAGFDFHPTGSDSMRYGRGSTPAPATRLGTGERPYPVGPAAGVGPSRSRLPSRPCSICASVIGTIPQRPRPGFDFQAGRGATDEMRSGYSASSLESRYWTSALPISNRPATGRHRGRRLPRTARARPRSAVTTRHPPRNNRGRVPAGQQTGVPGCASSSSPTRRPPALPVTVPSSGRSPNPSNKACGAATHSTKQVDLTSALRSPALLSRRARSFALAGPGRGRSGQRRVRRPARWGRSSRSTPRESPLTPPTCACSTPNRLLPGASPRSPGLGPQAGVRRQHPEPSLRWCRVPDPWLPTIPGQQPSRMWHQPAIRHPTARSKS